MSITRRIVRSTTLLAAALSLACCADHRSTTQPPNVIVISVDTLRADRLNCYGYGERTVSPNIDALAGDGVLFETQIAASSWTTPSHMSLLTAMYPSGHGVIDSFAELRFARNTFNKLAESRTTLAEALSAAGLVTGAFTGGLTLDPQIGFGQGFATYDTSMYKVNDKNTGAVVQWLREHADRPFFLFLHDFEVHAPYLRTQLLPAEYDWFRREFDEAAQTLELLDVGSLDTHIRVTDWAGGMLIENGLLDLEVVSALYDGGILTVDAWIGRLVEELRGLGIYDRTILVFTSDHGEELADHSQYFWDHHGHSAYEELVHVPLIVKLPDQEFAGTRVSAVTSTVHVMPTLLDVLGIYPISHEMRGRSLRPLWEGTDHGRDWVAFIEAMGTTAEIKAVRDARYKYVVGLPEASVVEHGRCFIPETPELRMLFDLQEDPGEQVNLLAGEPTPTTLELAAALDQDIRKLVTGSCGATEDTRLDDETIERLRSLGYID